VEGIRVLEDTAAELETAVLLRFGILYSPGAGSSTRAAELGAGSVQPFGALSGLAARVPDLANGIRPA
jgi:hypothetical protein